MREICGDSKQDVSVQRERERESERVRTFVGGVRFEKKLTEELMFERLLSGYHIWQYIIV